METEKILSILRLQATRNVGAILAKKLISTVGSVEQIFNEKASVLTKIPHIGTQTIKYLFNKDNLKKAEKELIYIQKQKIEYSYFLDKNYPKNLSHCVDSPILFFKDGSINLNTQKIISIVGTRNMTSYGREFCNELITDLRFYNPIIVSGFAYGVDIFAHKSALKNNLQTVAVLAHGIGEVYPKAHKKYIHEVHKNGGFITEFWHTEKPQRENFLKRNRIVAGLSKATIIIESATKGGSLVTADIANSYNRDVFALMGRVNDIYSQGCNNLIKNNQAHLLSSAQDIVQMLNWDISKISTPEQQKLFVQLDLTEQKIYDYLLQNGKKLLDVIALECHIPVYQLSSILLQMELKGVIKPLPGKLFGI